MKDVKKKKRNKNKAKTILQHQIFSVHSHNCIDTEKHIHK